MTILLATATRNAAADAVADRCETGSTNSAAELRIYSGSAPSSANDSATGTLLAAVTLDNPAFGASSSGVVTLADTPISTTGESGAGSGTAATYFRIVDLDEATVLQGSVGTSAADLILNTTTISSGVAFEITSGTLTMPSGE